MVEQVLKILSASTPFLDAKGLINRDWYSLLSRVIEKVLGPEIASTLFVVEKPSTVARLKLINSATAAPAVVVFEQVTGDPNINWTYALNNDDPANIYSREFGGSKVLRKFIDAEEITLRGGLAAGAPARLQVTAARTELFQPLKIKGHTIAELYALPSANGDVVYCTSFGVESLVQYVGPTWTTTPPSALVNSWKTLAPGGIAYQNIAGGAVSVPMLGPEILFVFGDAATALDLTFTNSNGYRGARKRIIRATAGGAGNVVVRNFNGAILYTLAANGYVELVFDSVEWVRIGEGPRT